MSGRTVRVWKRATVSFTTVQALKSGSCLAADRVDASQYTSVDMTVRVHAVNIAGGGTIDVELYSDGYTDEDPGAEFRTLLTSVQLNSNTSAGSMMVVTVSTKVGAMVSVFFKGTQGALVDALQVNVSVDLIFKGA